MSARDRQRAADFRELVRDDAALEALRGVDPDAAQYEAFAAHVGPEPRSMLAQAALAAGRPYEALWREVYPDDWEAFAARVGPAPRRMLAAPDLTLADVYLHECDTTDEVGDYDPPYGDDLC